MARKSLRSALLSLLLACPFGAWAVDGQVDIAALPIEIDQPGSYVVVADLRLDTPDLTGIVIVSDNVTLDLHGHALSGPGQSVGEFGSGIYIADGVRNTVIRHGTIRDWRLDGIQAGGAVACRVEGVNVSSNGGWGIIVGDLARIERCLVENNNGGVHTGSRAVVLENQSADSLVEAGIQTGGACEVRDNVCSQNFLSGIHVESDCHAVGNICTGNGQEGIIGFRKCRIENNECNNNGGDGIRVEGSACVIRENIVSTNGGDGIQMLHGAEVIDNRCTNNGRTDLEGVGIRVTGINNQIRGNTSRGGLYGLSLERELNIVANNRLSGGAGDLFSVPNNRLDILIESLPFPISWPGVYRLGGSIYTDDPSTHGVTIRSDNVTLDLGGHALIGPGKDTPSEASGIHVDPVYHNLIIRNGTIQDWPECGVSGNFSLNSRYEDLCCFRNGVDGLFVGGAALLTDVSAEENGAMGFRLIGGSSASRCTASSNGVDGFEVGDGIVQECKAWNNQGSGIVGYSGARIEGNSCSSNQAAGVSAFAGTTVSGNTCSFNLQDGIWAENQCRVVENTCTANALESAGIRVTQGGSVVEGNVVTNNHAGILCNPDTGNYFASNRANGNATNYDIAPGNTQGSGDLANITF